MRPREIARQRLGHVAAAVHVMHEARVVALGTLLALHSDGDGAPPVAGHVTGVSGAGCVEAAGAEADVGLDAERHAAVHDRRAEPFAVVGQDDEVRLTARPRGGLHESRGVGAPEVVVHGAQQTTVAVGSSWPVVAADAVRRA